MPTFLLEWYRLCWLQMDSDGDFLQLQPPAALPDVIGAGQTIGQWFGDGCDPVRVPEAGFKTTPAEHDAATIENAEKVAILLTRDIRS